LGFLPIFICVSLSSLKTYNCFLSSLCIVCSSPPTNKLRCRGQPSWTAALRRKQQNNSFFLKSFRLSHLFSPLYSILNRVNLKHQPIFLNLEIKIQNFTSHLLSIQIDKRPWFVTWFLVLWVWICVVLRSTSTFAAVSLWVVRLRGAVVLNLRWFELRSCLRVAALTDWFRFCWIPMRFVLRVDRYWCFDGLDWFRRLFVVTYCICVETVWLRERVCVEFYVNCRLWPRYVLRLGYEGLMCMADGIRLCDVYGCRLDCGLCVKVVNKNWLSYVW